MKKLLTAIVVLLCSTSLFAQKYSEIKGTVKSDKIKEVTLFYVEDGSQKQYAVTKVNANGKFGFTISVPSEAFYTIGNTKQQSPIYIKPNDKINIDIDESGVSLVGKNSKENVELYKWENYSKNIKDKSVYFMGKNSTYVDFFPEFEKYIANYETIYNNVKSGNAKFDELLRNKIKYDIDFYAINFLYTPRSAHPKPEQVISYYETIISKDKFNSDIVLSLPDGNKIIACFGLYVSMNKKIDGISEELISHFKNDRIKGEYVIAHCRVKDFVGYEAFVEANGKYIITPSQKQRLDEICAKVASTKPGEKASNFTYPDMDGKMVSLNDFLGKIVVVDVWATWCSPCRGEFPHLIAIEKEFHNNKDVVFMGVSVDEEKNKEAWKKMVKDEGLGGVQLFASGWSKITKDYKITGIPRFMIFDKKGNIYSADAPRPSSPELKKILLKLLAE